MQCAFSSRSWGIDLSGVSMISVKRSAASFKRSAVLALASAADSGAHAITSASVDVSTEYSQRMLLAYYVRCDCVRTTYDTSACVTREASWSKVMIS